MRTVINTLLPLGLIAFGAYWALLWYTSPRGMEMSKLGLLIGVFPAVAGALWLASDWFEL